MGLGTAPSGSGHDDGALWGLRVVVLLAVLVFASWTLAYHLCLALSLAAKWIWPIASAWFLTLAFVLRADLRPPSGHAAVGRPAFHAAVLGLLLALLSLFVLMVNPDDVNYFHRALYQLERPDLPFSLLQTEYNESGLPALTMAHVLTAHEHFVAMGAHVLGIDPLYAYHKLSGAFGYLLFVFVYVLLFRELGLSARDALLATLGVVGFCLLDMKVPGRTHGNVLLALYNGKVLLWGVGIPLVLWLGLRYWNRPGPAALLWVGLAASAAIGLSGSGIFLIPASIAGISLACFLASERTLAALLRAGVLNLASLHGLAIGVAALAGWLPVPEDLDVVESRFSSIWWENLALVLNHPSLLVRDALLLGLVPLVALAPRERRMLVLVSLCSLAVFANPLTGPLWIGIVTPGAYWRMWFLLPVLTCAGLASVVVLRSFEARNRSWLQIVAMLLVLGAVVFAYASARHGFARVGRRVDLAAPSALRFPPEQVRFAEKALVLLEGRNILTAREIFPTLALLGPSLRFEAGRFTIHTFANTGRREEGERRDRAMAALTRCAPDASDRAALAVSLQRGVDALVIGPCAGEPGERAVDPLPESEHGDWTQTLHESGYTLWLRRPTAPLGGPAPLRPSRAEPVWVSSAHRGIAGP